MTTVNRPLVNLTAFSKLPTWLTRKIWKSDVYKYLKFLKAIYSGTELTVTFNPYDGWHGNPTLQLNCEKQSGKFLIEDPQNGKPLYFFHNFYLYNNIILKSTDFGFDSTPMKKTAFMAGENNFHILISEVENLRCFHVNRLGSWK